MVMTQEWTWTLHKSLPSDLDLGHGIIELLMQALETAKWEGRDLFHIGMAIEEAVVNAIEHGNKRNPDKKIHLDFRVSPEICYMQVTDEGEGFCREMLKDCTEDENLDKPRGRGVMLIEELMSEAKYNERGNQVTMIRKRNDPQFDPIEEND